MRNWLKRQGIAPGNIFSFAMATAGGWSPPHEFTVRLGNMKETLASCTRIDTIGGSISVNLYTLLLVLSHKNKNYTSAELIKGLSSTSEDYQSTVEYVMPQYIILRNVVLEKWLSYIEGFY